MKYDLEHTLLTLASQVSHDSWVPTLEVTDAMDWSIYQARIHRTELRISGLNLSRQRGKGRLNALEWGARMTVILSAVQQNCCSVIGGAVKSSPVMR